MPLRGVFFVASEISGEHQAVAVNTSKQVIDLPSFSANMLLAMNGLAPSLKFKRGRQCDWPLKSEPNSSPPRLGSRPLNTGRRRLSCIAATAGGVGPSCPHQSSFHLTEIDLCPFQVNSVCIVLRRLFRRSLLSPVFATHPLGQLRVENSLSFSVEMTATPAARIPLNAIMIRIQIASIINSVVPLCIFGQVSQLITWTLLYPAQATGMR